MQRYTSVQKLRGILFLMIFVFYCGIAGTGVFWGGVEIFLLLSGLFIARNSLNLSQHTCNRKLQKKNTEVISALYRANNGLHIGRFVR